MLSLKPQRTIRTWPLLAPSVALLAVWAVVPLALTLWYSFQNYNLQSPPATFTGFDNYYYLFTDPDIFAVIWNTIVMVVVPIAVTLFFGTVFALLYDGPFPGRAAARLLVRTRGSLRW